MESVFGRRQIFFYFQCVAVRELSTIEYFIQIAGFAENSILYRMTLEPDF